MSVYNRVRADRRTVHIDHFLRIAPRHGSFFWRRLSIRVEENDICFDTLLLQLLCDVFGIGKEIASNMLNARTSFLGQQLHHLWRRRSTACRPDLGPSFWTIEQCSQGVETGYAIGPSHNRCLVLDRCIESWEAVENAVVFDGKR